MPLVTHTVGDDGVAIIVLDNPPANVSNAALRSELHRVLLELRKTSGVRGGVITGAGSNFLAGSDIAEFDGPILKPQLPEVIAAVETLPFPVVAAISGLALGGGFELALGCDGRVCDLTAMFAFPEVGLGILPGAGGTVRATRLAGIPFVVDLVASTRRMGSDEALSVGLVDKVVTDDLVGESAAFALALGGKRLATGLPAPHSTDAEVAAAVEKAVRRARPNVVAAADIVVRSAAMDASEALVEERALFNDFRSTVEAQNLRYLFFARQAAARQLRFEAKPARVTRIGVAGAGTMGASLARLCVASGFQVVVYDLNEVALARLSTSNPEVEVATTLDGFRDVDVLIDAVFEDMAVKQQLLAAAEPVLRPDAVVASNTSYLDLNVMGEALDHPERFGGLHFFNPADRNPLVEVIRATRSDDRTVATLAALATRLGKAPISAGLGDGFVANKIYADYRAQAEFLLEDGALPQDVDAALMALGFPIGPFAVADMSGLDIAWAMRKRRAATRNPSERYVTIADTLCELGRLGKKTDKGWYRYGEGAKRGAPDPEVEQVIVDARAARGIEPRSISPKEIQDRVIGAMVAAGADLVVHSIAALASDVDVAMTEGFAFPRWLGGPLRLASRLPEGEVIAMLSVVYESSPVTYPILKASASGRMPEAVASALAAVRPA